MPAAEGKISKKPEVAGRYEVKPFLEPHCDSHVSIIAQLADKEDFCHKVGILCYNSDMKSRKLWSILGIIFSSLAVILAVAAGFGMLFSQLADDEAVEVDETLENDIVSELEELEVPNTGEDEIVEEAEEAQKERAGSKIVASLTLETYAVRPQRNLNEFINLQGVVDRWLASVTYQEAAVEIFDVDYNTVAASSNADASMYPRSLYKLFYVYDAYAQIDAGVDDANQAYFAGNSLGYCLDIIVRQSDNACAEAMLNDQPRLDRVEKLISELGLANTIPTGLKTSAHDISLLLQHYYTHPELSSSSWQSFRSSALGQAWTYRKGLPSGFTVATVYDKAGWTFAGGGFDVYNDAALVEFPTGDGRVRRYIMVVMTSYPSSYTILTQLGEMLEEAILYGV